MRSLVILLATLCLAATTQAQSLAEHAAAAAGATIGTAAGKPLSNAISTIFGNTDKAAQKAAAPAPDTKKTLVKPEAPVPATPAIGAGLGSGPGPAASDPGPAPSRHGGFARRPPVAQLAPPDPTPAPIEPPRIEPTAEQLASIEVGATEQHLLETLGQPESKVTIPDDEHLIVICQYWANGKQLGTVRLDNGQVVSVQTHN